MPLPVVKMVFAYDFRDPIKNRVERDPAFRQELLKEGIVGIFFRTFRRLASVSATVPSAHFGPRAPFLGRGRALNSKMPNHDESNGSRFDALSEVDLNYLMIGCYQVRASFGNFFPSLKTTILSDRLIDNHPVIFQKPEAFP
jgi:hypothetical protein